MQSRESEGGALVVIDEQERIRMDTEELERERAVLLPERIAMRRHKRRRRRNVPDGPEVCAFVSTPCEPFGIPPGLVLGGS